VLAKWLYYNYHYEYTINKGF